MQPLKAGTEWRPLWLLLSSLVLLPIENLSNCSCLDFVLFLELVESLSAVVENAWKLWFAVIQPSGNEAEFCFSSCISFWCTWNIRLCEALSKTFEIAQTRGNITRLRTVKLRWKLYMLSSVVCVKGCVIFFMSWKIIIFAYRVIMCPRDIDRQGPKKYYCKALEFRPPDFPG